MPKPDQRLIEDYIPIEEISAEARREKSIRKGHISTLHLWWARRPLVAARAAVYGALVPAPQGKPAAKKAAEFVAALCKYPGSPDRIKEASRHILEAHAARLSEETGQLVTVEDIEAGRAPRPRVLDMFAGGGSIPLEALRLGCEAYALDLNPVAHLIELCTLVYPQQYGAPDPTCKGSAPDGTWAGLAEEVEYWGKWVLERVRLEIGDLYPPIPDPDRPAQPDKQLNMNLAVGEKPGKYTAGMLTPVAYLWTRTVRCKNPACGAIVPLARQTWLAKKPGRFIALQPVLFQGSIDEKLVHYRVVEAGSQKDLGFDPEAGSKGGNVACPFCGTVADSPYIKTEGKAGRIHAQQMAVICNRPRMKAQKGEGDPKSRRKYLSVHEVPSNAWPNDEIIWKRIKDLQDTTLREASNQISPPDESIESNPRSMDVDHFGLLRWSDLYIPRQLLSLMTLAKWVRYSFTELINAAYDQESAKAISTYLGFALDRLADWNSTLCSWAPENTGGAKIRATFSRQALPMVWDFVESGVFGDATGSIELCIRWVIEGLKQALIEENTCGKPIVERGSAFQLPWNSNHFDAVITDPPYYDNVSYSNLADFFYVWLKRSIGFLYPEHFSGKLTPKKQEAIAAFYRHSGDKQAARESYEGMMARTFQDAARVLKPGAPMVIVYAHKTTMGWATLIDALRNAGFMVTEAWPLDTEMSTRIRALETASLASSIFLIARSREGKGTGSYESEVRFELFNIVRERMERLWSHGVTGADLVIACVGAGLRAFTRYASVEYANGEPVPADSFLAEVEGAVLEALLEKLFGVSQAGIGQIDPATRFYVLWRYAYRQAALEAGEAIVFAYPQGVELDGPRSLTAGPNPLVVKQKSQYLLRDFTERGDQEDLGIPEDGQAPRLIDVLHRLLWLVENRPALIPAFLDQARPDVERLRLVAQALAGQALAGNGEGGGKSLIAARGAEAAALRKLTTNWRTLIESHRGPMV
jgi:putative DNA methylase